MRDSLKEGTDCPHAAAAVRLLMGKNRTQFGGFWRICSVLAVCSLSHCSTWQRVHNISSAVNMFKTTLFGCFCVTCHSPLSRERIRQHRPIALPTVGCVLPEALHQDIQAAGRNTVVNLCLLNALVWPWAPAAELPPLFLTPPPSFLLCQLSGESVWASLWCTIIRTQVWFKVISMNLLRKLFKLTGALTL